MKHDYTDDEIRSACKDVMSLRAFLEALPARPQTDEIAALKAALAESEKQFQDKVYEIARLLDECDKAQGILKSCLSVMPFGNIKTHTFENLPGRIADLASEIASLSLENERLEAELAALRQSIQSDDGISLGQVAHEASKKYDEETHGGSEWKGWSEIKCQDVYEAADQAVTDVVLAQAVRRMDAVPKVELRCFYNGGRTIPEGLEFVRARLIAAAKGEGQAVVVNEPPQDEGQPDLSGESEKQPLPCVCGSPTDVGTVHRVDGPCYQESAQPTTSPGWTPTVGQTVRLKSGGPVMTVTDVDPLSLMCAWMNASNELQVEPITTLCLTPVPNP